MDDFIEEMMSHFRSDGVRQRFETCCEFSIVEQWFRGEMYRFLRETMGWSVLMVEGPYCTRAPTKSHKEKSWRERQKWCDMVAICPDGVHWFELKAIWYRKRSWKTNLNSALKDLLALAGMDESLTADIWDGSGQPVSLGNFLRPYAEKIRKGPHHRYSICLLQAVPDIFLEEGPGQNLFSASEKYLQDRSMRVVVLVSLTNAAEKSLRLLRPRDPSAEACHVATGISPKVYEIGYINRGQMFPEENPAGRLAVAVWKVP